MYQFKSKFSELGYTGNYGGAKGTERYPTVSIILCPLYLLRRSQLVTILKEAGWVQNHSNHEDKEKQTLATI